MRDEMPVNRAEDGSSPISATSRPRRQRTFVVLSAVAVLALAYAGYTVWKANIRISGYDSGHPQSGAPTVGLTTSANVNPDQGNSQPGSVSHPAVSHPAVAGFPNAANTGIPAGTKLSPYTGSCVITTNNIVIDGKTMNCDVVIRAKGVLIMRSKINGQIGTSEETPYSYTLQDSEVDAGTVAGAAVGSVNMKIVRVDIQGGATSVYCFSNCLIQDSWLHGQKLPAGADWHLGAFLANDDGVDPDGTTNARLIHNTIHCDAVPNSNDGGCSGNINLYGDFGPISHVTIDHNLFGANTGISYCVYGGQSTSKPFPNADNIVIINNVFQRGTNRKCGAYGPVSSFSTSRPGNRWENNIWDDGAHVGPAN